MILKYEKYIATFFNLLFTFFASVLIARGLSLSDRGFYGEILYYSSLAAMIFCPPILNTYQSLLIGNMTGKTILPLD